MSRVDVIIKRRTQRLAPRSPDIDGFLPDVLVPVLYERWNNEKWGAPSELRGGIKSITCDMVKEVGFQELSRVYGVRRAKTFIEAANKGAL